MPQSRIFTKKGTKRLNISLSEFELYYQCTKPEKEGVYGVKN